jgi:hypothetical protein
MIPLFLYALFAGLMGFCIHKKWYGGASFAGAMLVWMLLVQVLMAYMSRPNVFNN